MGKTPNFEELLHSLAYNPDYRPPADVATFKINGECIGSLGSFSVISGMPKSGKSLFIKAALASYTTGQKFNIELRPDLKRPWLGYFDTESSPYEFYNGMELIKKFSGQNIPGTLAAFHTRRCDSATNKTLIEIFVKKFNPSILIIDGLLDLLMNFNDEKESRLLIDWLKALTDNNQIFILGVIHTGKKEGFTLGHLGSMIDRYAQSILEVTKDNENNLYRLSAKYLRSSKGFEDIGLMWSGSEWIKSDYIPNKKK